jgi:DNA-binding XRE family transcriptional regulator
MLGFVTSRQTYRAEAPAGFARTASLRDQRPLSMIAETDFLRQLGARVRTMRSFRGLSRRELARRSGISERYLALIEAGKGNVSIVLLLRIAHAVRD